MVDMKYPNWIYKFLSQEEIESISHAVQEAESKTSGEIVPVIVKRSSSVGHLPILITTLLLLGFFVSGCFEVLDHEFKLHFSNILGISGAYISLLPIFIIFYLISLKLSELQVVQRVLISDMDKAAQVHKRALLEFYLNHVTKTEYKTGIIIFISLMERQTVVMGDEAISKKLPAETWQKIVDKIISAIKENKTAEGLKSAISNCGEILSQNFPDKVKNPNELENHLVIKD